MPLSRSEQLNAAGLSRFFDIKLRRIVPGIGSVCTESTDSMSPIDYSTSSLA